MFTLNYTSVPEKENASPKAAFTLIYTLMVYILTYILIIHLYYYYYLHLY